MFSKYLQDRAGHMHEFSSEHELKSYCIFVHLFVFLKEVLLKYVYLLTGHKTEISPLASQGYGALQSLGQRGANFLQLEAGYRCNYSKCIFYNGISFDVIYILQRFPH